MEDKMKLQAMAFFISFLIAIWKEYDRIRSLNVEKQKNIKTWSLLLSEILAFGGYVVLLMTLSLT